MSACQFAPPRETNRFPGIKFLWFFCCWEILLQFYLKNSNWLILDKNIKHFTCDILLLLGETALGKNTARISPQDLTFACTGLLLDRVRMESLLPTHASHIFLCVSFVQTVAKWQPCRHLTWNRVRLFHRHDQIVAPCAQFHTQSFDYFVLWPTKHNYN